MALLLLDLIPRLLSLHTHHPWSCLLQETKVLKLEDDVAHWTGLSSQLKGSASLPILSLSKNRPSIAPQSTPAAELQDKQKAMKAATKQVAKL